MGSSLDNCNQAKKVNDPYYETVLRADYFDSKYFDKREDLIDCGTNEDLFKAVAALRDDSDYMQWFVTDKEISYFSLEYFIPRGSFVLSLSEGKFQFMVNIHKATVQELIDGAKNKKIFY